MSRARLIGRSVAVGVGCGLLIAACGGSAHRSRHHRSPVGPPRPKVIDVFSSLPDGSSPGSNAIVAGIRLAWAQAHGRAGGFVVHYMALSDSRSPSGAWNLDQTASNAEAAATDPRAVLYIGDVASAATEVSAPILNQAGIPQIAPGSPYVGLTESVPGVTASGEPEPKFDPTGTRTLLRVVPDDPVQAAAMLSALKLDGCTRVAVAADGSGPGATLSALIRLEQHLYGVDVVSVTAVSPRRAGYASYAATIRSLGATCLAFTGTDAGLAVDVTRAVHAVLPTAPILGSSGICRSAWTDLADGGVPAIDDPQLQCTSPALPVTDYPGGAAFAAAYRAADHGRAPAPAAMIGYEAMKLGLDTITSLGSNGDSRTALLRALFSIRPRDFVTDAYGFDKDGDSTLHLFGLYTVNPGTADPRFKQLLNPARTL